MTEKQGGSDVRANTTRAEPDGEGYRLTGHKWFCSRADVRRLPRPRARPTRASRASSSRAILDDGTRNTFRLQRLKDKLGNRSNASSEVEFDQTYGRMVGEPGRGVPTIIEMVAHTRLDCVIGSAAGMRWAVANATWHAAHRSAFGKTLADQPLMQNVLADLAHRVRGRDRAGDAPGARVRRGGHGVQAPGHRGRQVLGVQALPRPGVRGDGVPGRQRLRRGLGDAAPVPRGAGELDLGGLGQRQRARRPARAGQDARGARGATSPRSTSPPAPTRASTRSSPACATSSPTSRASRCARGGSSRSSRSRSRARCSCATRPRAVADAFCAVAPGRRRRPGLRHAARGRRRPAIVERHTPGSDVDRTSELARTVGRMTLAFREAGTRDAPVALLLHGYPNSSYMWKDVLPAVADAGWRAVAPDFAGFGDSPPLRGDAGTWTDHVAARSTTSWPTTASRPSRSSPTTGAG